MKKYQSGTSVVEVLLVFVITGSVGFVGWYVWNNRPDNSPQSTTQTSTSSRSNVTSAENDVVSSKPNQGYITIKEYGIKVKAIEADKLTYTVGCGNPYCAVTLEFSQLVTTDKNCNFVAEITQGYQVSNMTPKKIGDNYYGIMTNSRIGVFDFSKCSSAINSLRDTIYKSITTDNISVI